MLNFNFSGSYENGMQVELGNCFMGIFMPFQSKPINNGSVSFDPPNNPLLNNLALRVLSNGKPRLRTGVLDLVNGGDIDSQGNFESTYLISDPETTSILLDTINENLSERLPIINEGVTVIQLSISQAGSMLLATGVASTRVDIIGNVAFAFEYLFLIEPNTNACNTDRLLSIKTINLSLNNLTGGFWGFLLDLFMGLLHNIIRDNVVDQMEDGIQKELDAYTDNEMSQQELPLGTTISVDNVNVTPGGEINITAYAGINLNIACASTVSSGSVKLRSKSQIKHLRTLRDVYLKNSPIGKEYVKTYYRYNKELLNILVQNPKILKSVDQAIDLILGDFKVLKISTGRLSKNSVSIVIKTMKMVQEKASNELSIVIKGILEDVSLFAEKSPFDVFANMMNSSNNKPFDLIKPSLKKQKK